MEKGNNKEITNGENPRDRKPGEKIRNHRWKHHQPKTRDSKKNLRCRKYFRKHWNNSQRKWKIQKSPNPKYPGNPGHNEKTIPKDNRYKRNWRFPTKKTINNVKEDRILKKFCWFNWWPACRRMQIDWYLSPCTKLKEKVDQEPPNKTRHTEIYRSKCGEESQAHGHRGKFPEKNNNWVCSKIKNWQMGPHKIAKLFYGKGHSW